MAEASAALLALADAVQSDYERRKRGEAALDYDDLIVKTQTLLLRSGAASWVLYKVDGVLAERLEAVVDALLLVGGLLRAACRQRAVGDRQGQARRRDWPEVAFRGHARQGITWDTAP